MWAGGLSKHSAKTLSLNSEASPLTDTNVNHPAPSAPGGRGPPAIG